MKVDKFSTFDYKLGQKITDDKIVDIDGNNLIVKHKNKQGLISLETKTGTGKELIKPKYDYLKKLTNNLYIATNNYYNTLLQNELTLVDSSGKELIKKIKGDISLVEDMIIVNDLHNSYIYNLDGEIIKEFPNLNIKYLEKDIFKSQIGSFYGLASISNGEIFEPIYRELEMLKHHLYKVRIGKHSYPSKNYGYGLIDHTGKELIKPKYESLKALPDDNFLVLNHSNKWKIINKDDKKIVSFKRKYEDIRFNNQTTGIYQLDRKFGLIDITGKELTDPIYDMIGDFKDGVAFCYKDKKFQLIDLYGNKVGSFIFQDYSPFKDGIAIVKMTYGYHLINNKGQLITKEVYQKLIYNRGLYIAFKDDKWHLLDKEGRQISDQYDRLDKFNDQFVMFEQDNKYGLLDLNGNVIIPAVYEERIDRATKSGPLTLTLMLIRMDKHPLSHIKYYYSLWNNTDKILDNISINNNSIKIINEDQIIINGYLFNINQLKQIYLARVNVEGVNIEREFASEAECDKYIERFNTEIIKEIKKIKLDTENKIEQIENESDEKIKKLLMK